ncbi:hypothetical protein P153DRAFT_369225 [Dothidotthia symphoricarpi CBS 119687]|uniref:ADF-H domain-containing protein n=1 Tax=Dothidotthia symphoricarpi CBS 119687 TaxID=1392245 RepID=A0A6A6A3R3_9PLEO|nr:uncharacterized protein P153DRAFT_369225 [Dothidotthia symphoricarpi CBS 119687]KAF2126529.1 hypothetical protein P153DRAFT_369225 [Dothidotthia symphoricarpi CBS 119687]
MSLNGLDAVQVTQAYQGALAEAGGWFLLKYTSRDAVEVLTRGSGGVGEARTAVAQYDETSPLYGLLLYRRRKVLVRYVPEGTSRLLQARVAVHFIAVTEKFAPHDLVLSISTPDELSDAALASACTLHTAAPSSSSSSGSSRQQKLSWIREESEVGSQAGPDDTTAHTATRAPLIPTIHEPAAGDEEPPSRNSSITSQAPEPEHEPSPIRVEEKTVESKPPPEISHVTIGTVTETLASPDSDLTDIHETLKSYDRLFDAGSEPRSSSQTARPDYNELYEHYLAQYTKPKVNLGPRPRASQESKRPHTSGSASQIVAKTVSSLPSNLRSATRKATEQKKTGDVTSASTISIPLPPTPSTPNLPVSPISITFTSRSPASVRSMPVSGYNSHRRSTGITQDKVRLMKAVELRKKQIKAQQEKQASTAEVEIVEQAKDAEPEEVDATASDNLSNDLSPELDSGVSFTVGDTEESDTDKDTSFGEDIPSVSTLDISGMVFAASQVERDDLNSTTSISSPVSALTHGSSVAPSTRPSSMSEDDHHKSEDEHSTMDLNETSTMDPNETSTMDPLDEQLSVGSSPTVVPESRTPIPSIHLRVQSNDDPFVTEDDRVTTLLPSSLEDEAPSKRSSKRESIIFMPSGEPSQQNGTQSKRRNRESMIMSTSKRQSWYESKEKRRAKHGALQVDGENSETEYMSDESFMEEIQSATLQEAKHMSVSKSPITPVFGRFPGEATTPVRSASQQYNRVSRLSPEQMGRKASGPWPPKHANTDTVVMAKKTNVSSGISQRIKALAEKSNRDSALLGASDSPSSNLVQRKSSFFATPPAVEGSSNARAIQRLGNPSFLKTPATTVPDKKPVLQPTPKATVYNVQKAEKPESVQVTARIVRDERTTQPALVMPTQNTPLELHQSPLIIDHQKPVFTPKSPPRTASEPTSPKAPSSSHSRDQVPNLPRSSSESSWKAFGRRMSESKSVHSQESRDEKKDEKKKDDKKKEKETRTSKLLKRMSSSMSAMPWKNSNTSSPLSEEDLQGTSLVSTREPPPPVHVGDLNIQFPDTLLWKRRWVEIDAAGNLVLSPSKSNQKGAVKRFHLSEFETPYPPDQDRQELPNSVVLDFIDGRTLQCACETYTAQAQVLQILREAHDAWLAYTQAA